MPTTLISISERSLWGGLWQFLLIKFPHQDYLEIEIWFLLMNHLYPAVVYIKSIVRISNDVLFVPDNVNNFIKYRISSYSFRGNYSSLNLEIQRSQFLRPKVTVHNGPETIQGWNLYEEIR